MWLLKDINGKIKYLKPNDVIKIGRKQAHVVLENDLSISRVHATIAVTLKDQIRKYEETSEIIIKDANSKYGTVVIRNGVHIKVSSEGFQLQISDMVKFGLQHHIFKVEYICFITATSRLSVDHKQKLNDVMKSIGGIITDSHDDYCTHLTATTATSTNKIISAIIAGIPIININYWTSVLNAIKVNKDLPDPIPFTLPLQDKGINTQRVSLKPNPLRKTLFKNKKIIFFSKTMYTEYKKMLEDAGGNTEFLMMKLENISEDLFTDNNIIMQITDDSVLEDAAVFNAILYEKMHERKLRMIAETEVPLAFLYVSLNQFCNPKYHFKELINRKRFKKDTSEILVLDTQDTLPSTSRIINCDILISNYKSIPETNYFTLEDFGKNENFISNKNNNEICSSKNICIMETEANLPKVDILKKDSSLLTLTLMNENCTKVYMEKINKINRDDNLIVKSKPEKQIKLDRNLFIETKSEDKNIDKPYFLDLESKKTESKLEIMHRNISSKKTIINELINKKDSKISHSKQNINFELKKLKCVEENTDNKHKLVEQTSNLKKKNKYLQKEWGSKEILNYSEGYKKRRKSSIMFNSSNELLKIKQNDAKKKGNNKFDKWGFKKSHKKVLDYDLDNTDENETKYKNSSNLRVVDEDSTSILLKKNYNISFDTSNSNEEDENIEIKSFHINHSKKSIKCIKTSSFTEQQYKDFSADVNSMKNKASRSFSIRQTNTLTKSNVNSSKIFKKVYNQIPINRILLSDMTAWTPSI